MRLFTLTPSKTLQGCVAVAIGLLDVAIGQVGPSIGSIDSLCVVNTTSGIFRGTYNETTQVFRFAGMPYAVPPVGERRFLPALPASPPPAIKTQKTSKHDKRAADPVMDASQFGASCHQYLNDASRLDGLYAGLVPPTDVDEDCLTINVYSSQRAMQRRHDPAYKGTPVMFYVHGGSFTHRTSDDRLIDGFNFINHSATFADGDKEPVLIVTFNYRMTIFGFPGAPQLASHGSEPTMSSNVGLLDRDLALAWTRKNARAFGGDPERITLWGQSAGASAIDAWLYSHAGAAYGTPGADGSGVVGVIIQSGIVQGLDLFIQSWPPQGNSLPNEYSYDSTHSEYGRAAIPDVAPSWTAVARRVGCGRESTPQQLACMRSKPWHDLMDAVYDAEANFAPVPDGKTWFSDFSKRAEQGAYARVPTLMGTNTDEGTVLLLSTDDQGTNTSELSFRGLTDRVITDILFECPVISSSQQRAQLGVPVYRYSYGGVWPDANSGRTSLGAFHGAEVPVVWGMYGPTPVAAATGANIGPSQVDIPPAEDATSRFFMDSFVAFANDPIDGLSKRGWPRYPAQNSSHTRSVAAIAYNNSGEVSFLPASQTDHASCVIVNPMVEIIKDLIGRLGGWI